MERKSGVSRGVSYRVSRSGHEATAKPVQSRRRGAGPYLVRSGSVYLFQIRVPKELGGGRGTRPVRISLGACPAKRARVLADLLAAEARARFERMRMQMMTDDENRAGQAGQQSGAPAGTCADERLTEAVAELRGELKTALAVVSQPLPRMTPEEETRADGWKGLVALGRELAKGDQGNRLVIDNAEAIRQPYVDKLMSTVSPLPTCEPAAPPKSFPEQATLQAATPVAAAAPHRVPSDSGLRQAQFHSDAQATESPGAATLDDEEEEAEQDPRFVHRPPSGKPRFSRIARSYFKGWEDKAGKDNKDVRSARRRAELFIELIGDHPADTYTGADLKAYVRLLKFWPGNNNERREDWTARQIIDDNREMRLKPLSVNSLKKNYIGIVRTIMAEGAVDHDFRNPFEKVRLRYPNTARPAKPTQPLSAAGVSSIFRTGVQSGLLDEAMLPLLGYLTGRRLSLLIHLRGSDFREKYAGVWVAETDGIVKVDGVWKRVPFKTDASTGFFVLHEFLSDIGFVDWARKQGDSFLFSEIMKLEDPGKSASSYMQRLYRRAGIGPGNREVFHSFRSGSIEEMRDKDVDARDRRLQAGHAVGDDEHDNYGFKSISETRARKMVKLPLNPDIDFSVYEGLDFESMARKTRIKGKRRD